MKRSRFSEEGIIGILKEREAGVSIDAEAESQIGVQKDSPFGSRASAFPLSASSRPSSANRPLRADASDLEKRPARPLGMNALQQQARFGPFVRAFNDERPHEALAMKRAAELYAPSPSHTTTPYRNSPISRRSRHSLVTACRRVCMYGKKNQRVDRPRRSARGDQGSRRRNLPRQLHELRPRLHRSGAENAANPRQPLRREVGAYLLGAFHHPCLRAGQTVIWCARGIRNVQITR